MKFPLFNTITSSYIWRLLAKMSMSIFVCSYPLTLYFFGSTQQSYYINPKLTARITLSVFILSIFFGFFFYILIDKPIRNIEKTVLFPIKIKNLARETQRLVMQASMKKGEED